MLTIKQTQTDQILQVADEDFPIEMHWYEATLACRKLGSEWRLPTINELEEIYRQLYIFGLGSFKSNCYWSCSQVAGLPTLEGNPPPYAWAFNFNNGVATDCFNKGTKTYVRAVRTI